MDLTETDAIARLAKAVADRWGKLDVLVVNAGVLPSSPRHRYRPQGLQPRHRHQHAGNPGPAHQLRSAAAQGGGGRVIGLTTSVATRPRAFWGAYAATKAAQEVLLDCYAQEVGNISAVKVAIVDPGATRTAMRARAYPGEDPMSLKTPTWWPMPLWRCWARILPARTGSGFKRVCLRRAKGVTPFAIPDLSSLRGFGSVAP
jgi:NAD(P)-dependent dehydrogenase (short-subunit alcohol dehydrogenase family)